MRITATAAVMAGANPELIGVSPVYMLSTKGIPFVEYIDATRPAVVSTQTSHLRVRLNHNEFTAALAVTGNCTGTVFDCATLTFTGALVPKAPFGNRPDDANNWLDQDEISALVAEHDRRRAIAALKHRIREEITRLRRGSKDPGFTSRMAFAKAKRDKASRKAYFEQRLEELKREGESFTQLAQRANRCMRLEWPVIQAWVTQRRRREAKVKK